MDLPFHYCNWAMSAIPIPMVFQVASGVDFKMIMELMGFVMQFVGMKSANYPQCSLRTLLVNAPRWFGSMYKIFKPLLRESTKAKIEIYNMVVPNKTKPLKPPCKTRTWHKGRTSKTQIRAIKP
jgi:hypothetical protein